jgi:hypothetical protein
MQSQSLEWYKNIIEAFSKPQQIEVLKIIKEHSPSTINENKSGIFINMSFLTKETIDLLHQYIEYVNDQENILKPLENQKQDFKNTFFTEKEYRDNLSIFTKT